MSRNMITYRRPQRGLTLVELLVAVALSGIVTIAAISTLTLAQRGFRSVDAESQLQDNARFASSIIHRIVMQAGYLNDLGAMDRNSDFKSTSTVFEPDLKGFNNASYKADLITGATNTATAGFNNSDLLILRYQTGEASPGSAVSDIGMINCAGSTASSGIQPNDRMISAFYISNTGAGGEPALMCAWQNNGTGSITTQPLVQGVESMQILYGVDGLTDSTAFVQPAKTIPPDISDDTIPEQYLRADQISQADEAANLLNWSRVRSIRVGLVLRGPPGSAPEKTVPAQYPLGPTMTSTDDTGSKFSEQSDGRLRKSITFTVHLRNPRTGV